jgi:5-(carboxyamino)imidazole ribonucleotide mutase
MPAGVPVATVAINNAKNAGILAAQILGTNNETIANTLQEYKDKMKVEVEKKAEIVEKGRKIIGY